MSGVNAVVQKADPVKQAQDLARTIQDTGPDPVMLACVIIFGLIAVGTIVFLIRSYNVQQNKTLDYFQERSMKQEEAFRTNLDNQRDQFREELGEQRKVHVVELNRQSEMFERSLDKIVMTNKEGIEVISNKLTAMEDRIVNVESLVSARDSGSHNRRKTDRPTRTPRTELKQIVGVAEITPVPEDVPTPVPTKRKRRTSTA